MRFHRDALPAIKPDVGNKWECSHVRDPAAVVDEERGVTLLWYGGSTRHNESCRERTEIGFAYEDSSGVLIRRYPTLPVLTAGVRPAPGAVSPDASTDLESFTSVRLLTSEFDSVSVYGAAVLRVSVGRYMMWYTGWAGDLVRDRGTGRLIPTNERIGCAESSDGRSWKRIGTQPDGCVLAPGTEAVSPTVSVAYPTVVLDPDGALRMWYAGRRGSTWAIYSAKSRDGLRWESAELALAPDGDGGGAEHSVNHPVAYSDGVGYHLLYESSSVEVPSTIRVASSDRGGTWRRDKYAMAVGPSGVWDSIRVYPGSTVLERGVRTLWYTGYGPTTPTRHGADLAEPGYLKDRAPRLRHLVGKARIVSS